MEFYVNSGIEIRGNSKNIYNIFNKINDKKKQT